ncbi:MAG: hypothetical protein J6B28_10285 [Eubacterium sp.]|nr:hypothetical protein [Eubacterium sp.]
MKKNSKIVKYPKTLNVNIGVIFFSLIFIYLIFNVYTYVTAKHVAYYEVDEGSIRVQTSYKGIALREEKVVYAANSGYVNYYLKDNTRAKKDLLICSVDENGDISNQISNAGSGEQSLSDEAYHGLVEKMKDYSNSYQPMMYYDSYTFKEDLQAELMEAVNLSALNSMSEYAKGAEADQTFHRVNAMCPGIVSYYFDGYESVTAENFTEGMLDESGYEKDNRKAASHIEAGEPLFKLITAENWQIVVEIGEELKKILAEDSVIKVKFKSDETTAWATYEIQTRGDKHFLILSFTNSVIRYASERFIDIELMLTKQEGLKIPNQSIVTKEFFIVPQSYFTKGGNTNSLGVLIEMTDDTGQKIQKFVATDIYDSTEESYYVNEEDLQKGTKIISPSGGEPFVIRDSEQLNGVYNINKGYTVFRIIDILYQNEEYTIISRGTDYGLSQYDHIALDGSIVVENEIINK